MFSGLVAKRREEDLPLLSLDGLLTPYPHPPRHFSSHPPSFYHINITSFLSKPPRRPPLFPSHTLPCPQLLGTSWLRGQQGSGARDSLARALSSLSPDPRSCSIAALSPSLHLSPFLCPPKRKHSSFLSHNLTHFSSPSFSFFAPSPAQAVLGWCIDWGFYSPSLTSSLSLPLSLFLSLYSFCSPVYCNAQTSLICVFVSVYLPLS